MKKDKFSLEEAIGCGVSAGLEWYRKLVMRCMLEGHRFGYREDEIQDYCIYCGDQNNDKRIKDMPISLQKVMRKLLKVKKVKAHRAPKKI